MTPEKIRKFLDFVQDSGLIWDGLSEAALLADKPEEFERYVRKTLSPAVVDMLFEGNMEKCPAYIGTKDMWLEQVAKWTLSQGG